MLADHVHRLGELGDVARHKVRVGEEVVERRDLPRRTHGHQVHDVVVYHVHAHRLGEDRELGANVSITNDAEGLATDLPTLVADLFPHPLVHLVAAVADLAGQYDDLADDQFGDTARVAEGGVEDAYSVLGGVLQVDLVRADTEASDHDEVAGGRKDTGSQLRLGANANYMDIPEELVSISCRLVCKNRWLESQKVTLLYLLNQLILGQTTLHELDLVTLAMQNIPASLVHILE